MALDRTLIRDAAQSGKQAIERLWQLEPAELHSVGTAISAAVAIGRVAWGPGARAAAAPFFDVVEQRCSVKTFPSFALPNCLDQSIAYATAMATCETKKDPSERRMCEIEAEATKGAALIACEMDRLGKLAGVRPPLPGGSGRPPRPLPLPIAIGLVGIGFVAGAAMAILTSPGRDLLVR